MKLTYGVTYLQVKKDLSNVKEKEMDKGSANKLNYFSTLKYLKQFFNKLYFRFFLFYLGRLVTMLEEIIVPILVGIMINQIVYYKNFPLFLTVSIVFLCLCVFSCLIYYLVYEIYSDFWNRIMDRVRKKMYSTMLHMEAEDMANANYGDLAQQIQWKVMACVQFIVRNVIHNVNNVLNIVICLVVVFNISVLIGAVFIIIVPISGFVSWKFGKKIRIERNRNQESYGQYISWLYEIFSSFKDLRLLGAEHRVKEKFKVYQKNLIDTDVKAGIAALMAQNIIANVNTWIQMILFALLAVLSVKVNLTIGSVFVVLTYFATMTRCLKAVCENYMDAQERMSVIQRLKDVMETPTATDQPGSSELVINHAVVDFNDVTFAYKDKAPIINNLNLKLSVGEKVAVVGESGCGKSTLAYMLLGFYHPQKGSIVIDDQSINECTLESLRKNIGIVQQEVLIFNGTVRENIMVSKPEATEDEMIAASKAAGVYDFVMEMDDKFDTRLGRKARKLSGGQKKRIAIARVYLKNPPIIIFDEATASLDKQTEAQIHANWREILKGRTAIVIAHRQSSVMLCDRVALMQGGQIIEQGTPEEMAKNSSAFRTLFALQEETL